MFSCNVVPPSRTTSNLPRSVTIKLSFNNFNLAHCPNKPTVGFKFQTLTGNSTSVHTHTTHRRNDSSSNAAIYLGFIVTVKKKTKDRQDCQNSLCFSFHFPTPTSNSKKDVKTGTIALFRFRLVKRQTDTVASQGKHVPTSCKTTSFPIFQVTTNRTGCSRMRTSDPSTNL